ncbi:hypothetical protein GGR53DRAFT_185979 [Hypoxylon sp. FL1150]|nr:hypothetical protein GGR53DRAFT_185979 [Hypoxylon sp. FL1150]
MPLQVKVTYRCSHMELIDGDRAAEILEELALLPPSNPWLPADQYDPNMIVMTSANYCGWECQNSAHYLELKFAGGLDTSPDTSVAIKKENSGEDQKLADFKEFNTMEKIASLPSIADALLDPLLIGAPAATGAPKPQPGATGSYQSRRTPKPKAVDYPYRIKKSSRRARLAYKSPYGPGDAHKPDSYGYMSSDTGSGSSDDDDDKDVKSAVSIAKLEALGVGKNAVGRMGADDAAYGVPRIGVGWRSDIDWSGGGSGGSGGSDSVMVVVPEPEEDLGAVYPTSRLAADLRPDFGGLAADASRGRRTGI